MICIAHGATLFIVIFCDISYILCMRLTTIDNDSFDYDNDDHDEEDEEPAGSFGVHTLLGVGAKGQMGRQVPAVIIL